MILLNGIHTKGEWIVFKGQILECLLPPNMQDDIPYDPRKLPAIIYDVYNWTDHRGSYVHIWERTRMFDYCYNRRIFAAYSTSATPELGGISQC